MKQQANWIFERFKCRNNKKINSIIDHLEEAALTAKLIKQRFRNTRRQSMMSVLKSCMYFNGAKIKHYRDKSKCDYWRDIDVLEGLGLLVLTKASSGYGGSVSYFTEYEPLLELLEGVSMPVPKPLSVSLTQTTTDKNKVEPTQQNRGIKNVVIYKAPKKKVFITPKQIRIDESEAILFKKLLAATDKYNNFLIDYSVRHPDIEMITPVQYQRKFIGRKLSDCGGGRYYTSHPFANTSNRNIIDGKTPRERIWIRTKYKSGAIEYPSISYDFTALHTSLLYLHKTGELYSNGRLSDPYELYPNQTAKQRSLVKSVALIILGSRNPAEAHFNKLLDSHNKDIQRHEVSLNLAEEWGQDYFPSDTKLQKLGDEPLQKIQTVVDDYKQFHDPVFKCYKFDRTVPATLQWIDSFLITRILHRLMDMDTVGFPFHDEIVAVNFNEERTFTADNLKELCLEELYKLKDSDTLNLLNKHLKKKHLKSI